MSMSAKFCQMEELARTLEDPADGRYARTHAFLADCYYYGIEVPTNLSLALRHYQCALLGDLQEHAPDPKNLARQRVMEEQIERCKQSLQEL